MTKKMSINLRVLTCNSFNIQHNHKKLLLPAREDGEMTCPVLSRNTT